MEKTFTHLTKTGDPTMIDVTKKEVTVRTAKARAVVVLDQEIIRQLNDGELHTKKGPVFQTAILAGIMGAKKTSELIPLCHPVGLDQCSVDIQLNKAGEVEVICTAKLAAKTGVEMEALTGASIAALTIYDMCKGFSYDIVIKSTELLEKKGGKNDVKRS